MAEAKKMFFFGFIHYAVDKYILTLLGTLSFLRLQKKTFF